MAESLQIPPVPKRESIPTALEVYMGQQGKYFDVSRFSLGTRAVGADILRAMPVLYEVVRDEVLARLKEKGQVSTDGKFKDKSVETMFNAVFASKDSFSTFVNYPDDQKIDYLTRMIRRPSTMTISSSSGTLSAPTVISSSEEVSSATNFKTAFDSAIGSANLSLEMIYKAVVENQYLGKNEKELFKRQFAVLFQANQQLGEAYLLTMYTTLQKGPKDAFNFSDAYKQQLDLMGNLWGETMRSDFDALRDKRVTNLTLRERYMNIVYMNLALGSVLVGGEDKECPATFGRAFVVGFIAGLDSTMRELLIKQPTIMTDALSKSMTDARGSVAALAAPATALIAFASGIATTITTAATDTVMSPWLAIWQQLSISVSAKLAKEYKNALRDDERRILNNPNVVIATFAAVVAYGSKTQGWRGRFYVTLQRLASAKPQDLKGLTHDAQKIVIDRNVADIFEIAMEVVDKKKYKTAEEVYSLCLAMLTIADSINSYATQQQGPDINGEKVAALYNNPLNKGQISTKDMAELFTTIIDINNTSKTPLNEIVKKFFDAYGAAYKESKNKDKALKAAIKSLKALLSEKQRERGSWRRVPKETENA